jgi:hypothetical protein
MPPGTLWLHCNGGHYYRAPGCCPASGYGHPRAEEIMALAARRSAATYEALFDAGLEEELVMYTLVSPMEAPVRDPWWCGFTAPPALVDLVVQRNAWLLERFPRGALAAALVRRPKVERVYAELPGLPGWHLADRRSLPRWPPAMTRERDEIMARSSRPGARLFSLLVDAEFSPLAIDPACWIDQPREHPLLPTGHLLLEGGIDAASLLET